MDEYQQLRSFVALMDDSHFGRAAKRLGISQSSVTKNLAQLETRTQLRLFDRTTRNVTPTDTARRLDGHARSALASLEVFHQEAKILATGEAGTLNVSSIALAAEGLIADALATLAVTRPNLRVEVSVGTRDIYQDLVEGRCELAVGDEANFVGSRHAASLSMTPIRTETIVLAHRIGHPDTTNAPALFLRPLAIPSRYYNENRILATFRDHGGPEEPGYRLNSLSACMALTAKSDVVTLVPETMVRNGPYPIEAARRRVALEVRLVLVRRSDRARTPAMRAFAEALRQQPV